MIERLSKISQDTCGKQDPTTSQATQLTHTDKPATLKPHTTTTMRLSMLQTNQSTNQPINQSTKSVCVFYQNISSSSLPRAGYATFLLPTYIMTCATTPYSAIVARTRSQCFMGQDIKRIHNRNHNHKRKRKCTHAGNVLSIKIHCTACLNVLLKSTYLVPGSSASSSVNAKVALYVH